MEKLTLWQLSIKGGDDLTEEETRLLNALKNSNITKLNQLTLSENPEWFRNEQATASIVDFCTKQTQLARLTATSSNVNDATKEALEAWKASNAPNC